MIRRLTQLDRLRSSVVANGVRMTPRWRIPVVLLQLGPVIGIAIGVVTTLINLHVYDDYYSMVLAWSEGSLSSRAVKHAIVEGSALGCVFSLLLAVSVYASARFRCPLKMVLGNAGHAVGITLMCWILGGIAGMTLQKVDAETFRKLARHARYVDGEELARFAWVGGSICGEYVGCGLGLLYAAIAVHVSWRRMNTAALSGFPVTSLKMESNPSQR